MVTIIPSNFSFLSTLSLRRATCYSLRHSTSNRHFYPRSPCGERRTSIGRPKRSCNFYPRSPCGERLRYTINFYVKTRFLSTLSLRRATVWHIQIVTSYLLFLSTLSLRRATNTPIKAYNIIKISIHALLAESDISLIYQQAKVCLFLSTLSLRRATRQ